MIAYRKARPLLSSPEAALRVFLFSRFCHPAHPHMFYFARPKRFDVICALIALLQVVSAKVELGNSVFNPVIGEEFEIVWLEADGPVTLHLVRGPSTHLSLEAVIAGTYHGLVATVQALPDKVGRLIDSLDSGIRGSDQYIWRVPTDLPSAEDYRVYITDGITENWSLEFALTGTGTVVS
ncbi:hypothetical protein F5X68DRAFT_16358 [Plectosphaerella plurivora]|uniref:Uncharacterized protein n=1 Tax=Plectosphaerella plurivora TaxID=936078 RepID=A0A9P9AAR8_9PEZI|nr:hypothetical protein F5X68DRAFT_16358 [Plectosphaerella plurivora]